MKKSTENLFTADGFNKCNKTMLFCAALLFIIGIVFVFEADRTAILSRNSKGILQIFWSALGLLSASFFLLINYKKLAHEKFLLFFLGVLTTMLGVLAVCSIINIFGDEVRVRLPGFGIRRINGAYRWLQLGPITFQPSVFVQVFLILFIASHLSKTADDNKRKGNVKGAASSSAKKNTPAPKMHFAKSDSEHFPEFVKGRAGLFLVKYRSQCLAILIFGLVLVQPSTSVAISVMLTAVAMMILKNPKILFRRISAIVLLVLVLLGVVAWNAFPHIRERIVRGGDNFQSRQAVLAIGSGGVFGLGLGNSEAKHSRLPEIENDYIFSLIAEETGFVGSIVFMGIYVLFIFMGFLTAMRAQDSFGKLAAFGFTVNYAFAFLVHLFVNLGFISTGAGLPFVSYGGTAMIADSIALGILLNISATGAPATKLTKIRQNPN
jgi:cell division protein FtsW